MPAVLHDRSFREMSSGDIRSYIHSMFAQLRTDLEATGRMEYSNGDFVWQQLFLAQQHAFRACDTLRKRES